MIATCFLPHTGSVWTSGFVSASQTEPKSKVSVCPNRTDVFFSTGRMSTGGAQGGESGTGEKEMEDHEEMEEDSTSNVSMITTNGAFIVGTTDDTVT